MSNAVYILSSLPFLRFGDKPPFSIAEFRSRLVGLVTDSELNALDALIAGESAEDPFIENYLSHEIQMRNVLGKHRAQEWGPDVRFLERPFKGYDVTFAKMVSDAYAKQNPIEREEDLDKARFWLVDELSKDENSMASVYAFAVKLMICERWARLSEKAGNDALIQVINDNDPVLKQGVSED